MIRRPSILALSIFTLSGAAAPISAAQSNALTPRQTFTSFATNTPLSALKFKPLGMPAETKAQPRAPEIEPVSLAPKPPAKPAPATKIELAAPKPESITEPKSAAATDDVIITNTPSEVVKTPERPATINKEIQAEALKPQLKAAPTQDIKTAAANIDTPQAETSEGGDEENTELQEKSVAALPKPVKSAKKTTRLEPDLAGPPAKAPTEKHSSLLPFYTTAPDYLEARGTGKQTQLKLVYNVSVANAKSQLSVAPTTAIITLGPDFAAVEKDEKTRIFDFKSNRILTLSTSGKDIIFDNISLYASALKNVNSVNGATKNGALEKISIGSDVKLDAFWLEASLGWAARGKFDTLKVTRNGNEISTSFKGLEPFSASLTGPQIPSEDHMRALFAWWNHDLPIHPAILPEIGRPDNAPQSMKILTFSPKFQDGLIATWDLKSSEKISAQFPLPRTAKTSIEAGKSSPLAFAISRAASGDALRQRPSPNDLRQEIHDKQTAGNVFEAWLAAQMLSDRIGGCDKDPALLCQDILDLEAAAEPESDLARLPKIIRKTRAAKTRLEGFSELAPYVEGNIAPAFLVKTAGQARARIKTSDLSTPELQALRADKLLEEALVKNPYDPLIYRTLGQVYAAQGQLADSWDMQDAMRRLPDVTEKLSAPINWAESSLLARAPGFFLDDMP